MSGRLRGAGHSRAAPPGNAAGGWLVEHAGVRAGLGLTVATGVLALLSTVAGRRALPRS